MFILKLDSWKKIYSIYFYERKSNIRKLFDDWGLSISLQRLKFWLIMSAVILFSLIFVLSFYFKDNFNKTNVLSFSLLLLLANIMFQALSFYNNNKVYFLLDTNKTLFQNKEFRILRLISKFLEISIKSTLFYWILLFFPFYLGTLKSYEPAGVFALVIATFIYFLISLFTNILFSFFIFLFSKLFQSLIVSNILNFVVYIFTCVFLFLLPFTLLSKILKQDETLVKFKIIVEGSFFHTYNLNHYLKIDENFILPLIVTLILGLLLNLLILTLWYYTLHKTDLLPYMNNKASFKPNYKRSPFAKNRHPFFVKDYIYLTRLNEWWWEHLGRTFAVLALISGISIPLIKIFLSSSSPLYFVSITILFSIYIYQIVGDSLRILLAIDHETKNMQLFINRKVTLWEIVSGKLKIYNIFVLTVTSLMVILSLFLIDVNPYRMLLIICISYTFGILCGIVQIATTALFPKKNWEHFYEIGDSKKAASYNDTLNTILIIVYSFIPISLYFTEEHFKTSFEPMAISITIILTFMTFLVYKITKLYLLKFDLKEIVFNND